LTLKISGQRRIGFPRISFEYLTGIAAFISNEVQFKFFLKFQPLAPSF
jgi:hypothetical protein